MDLSRDDYINDQFAKWRINRQPKPTGQMELPGITPQDEPVTQNGSTKMTPEHQQRGLNRIDAIRRTMGWTSRRASFTDGQTPAPYTEHHNGEPPCMGC